MDRLYQYIKSYSKDKEVINPKWLLMDYHGKRTLKGMKEYQRDIQFVIYVLKKLGYERIKKNKYIRRH